MVNIMAVSEDSRMLKIMYTFSKHGQVTCTQGKGHLLEKLSFP